MQTESKLTETKSIIKVQHKNIFSLKLKRDVIFDIYIPLNFEKGDVFPLLLINDGQDMEDIFFANTVKDLAIREKVSSFVTVAVHAGDRFHEYGVGGKPDYRKRGSKASNYISFLVNELLPFLESKYKISLTNPDNAIAGFSLGGLSAFDICWNFPEIFRKVGCFSASFWWRKKAVDKKTPDKYRIVHTMIKKNKPIDGLKFWFQAGTEDEKGDRNGNGIIDSIDDTLDVILELAKKGYRPYDDIVYHEEKGGKHDLKTWEKTMPIFLEWCFPIK
jgi:enterochelin esterase-like enzyme